MFSNSDSTIIEYSLNFDQRFNSYRLSVDNEEFSFFKSINTQIVEFIHQHKRSALGFDFH